MKTFFQNQLKQKPIFVCSLMCVPLPKFRFFSKPLVPPTSPIIQREKKTQILFFIWPERSMNENKHRKGPKWSQNYEKRNSVLMVGKVLLDASIGNQHASFAQHRCWGWCTWWTWTHSFSSSEALDLSFTLKS